MKKIFLIALLMVMIGCSLDLKRNNPLDPAESGIYPPDEIVIFALPSTSYGSINLQWEPLNDVAGYYVYRSLSYNGIYTRIADIESTDNDVLGTYEDFSDNLISETWYYYKVSGYTSNGLEGYRSVSNYTYFIDGSN